MSARPRTPTKRKHDAASSKAPIPRQQPMSPEQATHLKDLAGQALEPEAFRPGLTEAEAMRRIKALEAKLRSMDGPPHTV